MTLVVFSGLYAADSDLFKITVKTDNAGDSNATQFVIGADENHTYNYTLYCDTNDTNNSVVDINDSYTCNYATAGTYQIAIEGVFPAFAVGADAKKLLSVDQWGTQPWRSLHHAFDAASNFQLLASDAPDLSHDTNVTYMFRDATTFNADISTWDVSSVTDMNHMFWGATAFNQDLSAWDVSNVTNMKAMFVETLYDYNIGGWNTSNVTDMSGTFHRLSIFGECFGELLTLIKTSATGIPLT